MPFSVIIPTYNRPEILDQSLALLVPLSRELDMEIIVVNDSKDCLLHLGEKYPGVLVLDNPKSGVASARNLGLRHARHEKIIFMDDDMMVHREALLFIIGFLDQHPGNSINLNWIYPPDLQAKIRKTKFGRYLLRNGHADLKGWMDPAEWKENATFQIRIIASAILGITKSSVQKIGGYNERFPFAGFEDHDFASRLNEAGIQGYLNTSILVFHNEADRVEMKPWLERRKRNGQTRAVGVRDLNYAEYRIEYSGLKNFLFKMIYWFRSIYIAYLYLLPNLSFLDPLYALLFNPLLGAYIHQGYTREMKHAKN